MDQMYAGCSARVNGKIHSDLEAPAGIMIRGPESLQANPS